MSTGLMIYGLILIPIIGVAICSWFFGTKTSIWERVLIFMIPTLTIIVVKFVSVYSETQTTEYWNSYITSARYVEYWSTWDEETCTRCTSHDKEGNCTHTETYDCSHCDEHQPYWEMYDNLGQTFNISSSMFNELVKLWGNNTKEDLNRSINHHTGFMSSCGVDGDAYRTKYDNVFEHTIPVCERHTYENRIKCSRSLFNFSKIDSTTRRAYKLFDYPKLTDVFHYNPILGDNNTVASDRLSWNNAHFGQTKQVHMLILVFTDQSISAAKFQEAYWKNGNKNEFILCIGKQTGSDKIAWAYVISWTDVQSLKFDLASKVSNMKYDLPAIVDTMAIDVLKKYQRKHFKDFSYIKVEPSMNAFILALILALVSTVGICAWCIKNQFNLND